MPENKQAERSRQAREQIVQAALTVFALKGYAAASMEDLRLAAGCSKGGVYHHFKSKPAVLAAVIDRLAATGALQAHVSESQGDAVDAAAPSGARLLLDVWCEAARDPALRDRLAIAYQRAQPGTEISDGLELIRLLRIGALIQQLTQEDPVDAARAARRLGIALAA